MLSTRIPFAGFYESIWSYAVDREIESTIENLIEDRDAFERYFPNLVAIPTDKAEDKLGEAFWGVTDYSAAYAVLAQEYAAEFVDWLRRSLDLKELPFEFEEMTSPAYYNFETDRLFIKLPLETFDTLRLRLGEEAVAKAFRQLFTSYDGFASFYPNTVPDKPLADWDHNELYALLVAWIERELGDERIDDELYEGLYEEAYRAVDKSVDWEALKVKLEEAVMADLSDAEIELIAATPVRCPATLELPL